MFEMLSLILSILSLKCPRCSKSSSQHLDARVYKGSESYVIIGTEPQHEWELERNGSGSPGSVYEERKPGAVVCICNSSDSERLRQENHQVISCSQSAFTEST